MVRGITIGVGGGGPLNQPILEITTDEAAWQQALGPWPRFANLFAQAWETCRPCG